MKRAQPSLLCNGTRWWGLSSAAGGTWLTCFSQRLLRDAQVPRPLFLAGSAIVVYSPMALSPGRLLPQAGLALWPPPPRRRMRDPASQEPGRRLPLPDPSPLTRGFPILSLSLGARPRQREPGQTDGEGQHGPALLLPDRRR